MGSLQCCHAYFQMNTVIVCCSYTEGTAAGTWRRDPQEGGRRSRLVLVDSRSSKVSIFPLLGILSFARILYTTPGKAW